MEASHWCARAELVVVDDESFSEELFKLQECVPGTQSSDILIIEAKFKTQLKKAKKSHSTVWNKGMVSQDMWMGIVKRMRKNRGMFFNRMLLVIQNLQGLCHKNKSKTNYTEILFTVFTKDRLEAQSVNKR